jgi:hypothetical protein
MTDKVRTKISQGILLLIALSLTIKFGQPQLLKTYIKFGLGDCQKNPILCVYPQSEITSPPLDEEFLKKLVPYRLQKIEIYLPYGYTVIEEEIKRAYYKKKRSPYGKTTVYLLYKNPQFFVGLFPKLKEQGIINDYEFVSRTMHSLPGNIKNVTDALFMVIKAIFTPDLGPSKNIKMVKFAIRDKKGFISYTINEKENYFNCDILNSQGDFFKIYIKDKVAALDLDKVFTIISTVKKID